MGAPAAAYSAPRSFGGEAGAEARASSAPPADAIDLHPLLGLLLLVGVVGACNLPSGALESMLCSRLFSRGGGSLRPITFEWLDSRAASGQRRAAPSHVCHADLSSLDSIAALRALLSSLTADFTADLPGVDAAGVEPLEIYVCDAAGQRTRFAGRSQLAQLQRAHGLLVFLGSAPRGS